MQGYVSALHADRKALRELKRRRGLTNETLYQYDIGWDSAQTAYTIPVRDVDGELVNVRRYQLDPPDGRRKIWGVTGMNEPRLYPMSVFDTNPRSVVVCEGEWDALLTIQNGFPAVTRTGAANVWKAEWGEHFRDRIVYLCHDMDKKGQTANRKLVRLLEPVARDVRVLHLPYDLEEKHGKDLTDFWMDHDRDFFKRLVKEAREQSLSEEAEELDPSDATVLDSFDSRKVGRPLRLALTVKGKRDPGYSVPASAKYECTRDAGEKCSICPMNAAGGEAQVDIEPSDPVVLEMIESTQKQLHDVLRRHYGAMQCSRLKVDTEKHQAVEQLYARPSVDHMKGVGAADYKNMKITSVGRHDTMPNNTVEVVGALFPDPRKQLNEFLAWEVNRIETSLDHFELNAAAVKLMKRFRTRGRPLNQLVNISRDLTDHVTSIYGRLEMHAAMDLVFHSALSFYFGGQRIHRGWLQMLVVGDPRTGKSEIASALSRHYGAGELVNCEAASFAGIVGGMEQYGSGKEWSVSWGALPINDRRLVVLDEISGLQPEDIGKMSDVRSRGIAQLTKIGTQEQTHSRTRIICMGNPRNARMSEFTYGVQAIRPLIGTSEDIARFDLAMSVASGEVSSKEINRRVKRGELAYSAEACQTLLRWVWSRSEEQIKWDRGAEREVYRQADAMGKRYVEEPPLVQSADIRVKIARFSVALAARLFSTTDDHECILVKRDHVKDAVAFMDRVYNLAGFGYAERSREIISDAREATKKADDIRIYLDQRKGLAKFLRSNGSFRRQDLEEVMNVSREEANATVNTLLSARMVRKEKGDVRVEPMLHALLREVK